MSSSHSNSNAATIADALEDYRQDQIGANLSYKTVECHATALDLLCRYLEEERNQTQVELVDANDICAWFAYLRKVSGQRGRPRAERTVQTYARSARAFFYWLIRRGTLECNPFDQVVFPDVDCPLLLQTITDDEFERLLQACAPSNESGLLGERAACNRAILWLFYDTGIRVSELCGLRLGNFDRKHGIVTVMGKGSKERRIALGQNCLHNLSSYLDNHRPDEAELAEWESRGDDPLLLSETHQPLTRKGVEMLFKRLNVRAGITGKYISPHTFRQTFAIRRFVLGKDSL